MRKRILGMVLVTGTLILGGAGILQYQMFQLQNKKQVITVENVKAKEEETTLQETGETDTVQTKENAEKKVFLKGKGIYIPESATYEGKEFGAHHISWNGYSIFYSNDTKEKESDLSIGEAISIAKNAIISYGNNDAFFHEVSISLGTSMNEDDISEQNNPHNIETRYYFISINNVVEHDYTILLNSITGEITTYIDLYDKNVKKAKPYKKELESAEDIYTPLAKEFIQDTLGLGKVEKCYGFVQDKLYNTRPSMVFFCSMTNGNIVTISFDQKLKTVNCFGINNFSDEGQFGNYIQQ